MKARVQYKVIFLAYKALKYNEPKYLRDYLSSFRLETNIVVRHANDRYRLFEPRKNNKFGEKAFRYVAPRLFNKLPQEMKTIQDVKKFTKELKTLLFSRSYDQEELSINENFMI